MKVLVSGFTTFASYSENSSEIMASLLKETKIPGVELHTAILPVAFSRSWDHLKMEIDFFKPDVVICLGLAGNRRHIELEQVAINLIHCDIPDNEGVLLQDKLITEDGPKAYFSSLPLKTMREAQTPFPVTLSLSAGAYVCNFLFYRLMEHYESTNVKAGFIHLPHLNRDQDAILETLISLIRAC